jgi:hypothetical protein
VLAASGEPAPAAGEEPVLAASGQADRGADR